jgi:tRNA pseudouridine55 synthase
MRPALNGVVVVDKPAGPSSFAIVYQARKLTGVRKVGHGGTLDPAASGVLPVCFGEGTKLAQFLLDADKEYLATVRLGVATDSYDATGTTVSRCAASDVSVAAIEAALAEFRGWISQRPPVFSALKRDGKPLYAYARAGEEVTVEARRVRIDALEVLEFVGLGGEAPAVRLRVACSKGTYIRSLAHDLGAALGVGGHLEALRRTRSGPFTLAQAIPPEALASAASHLVSPAEVLTGLPAMTLSAACVLAVSQGKAILWQELGTLPLALGSVESTGQPWAEPVVGGSSGEGPAAPLVRFLDPSGALVAVATPAGPAERVRTLRVFGREG